jgi:hypothetical protein
MKSQELRFTETNSADDSKGRTWGFEGDLFWFIAGGAFAFVIVLLLCFSALRMSFTASLVLAAIPLTLCVAYVVAFRQGKPKAYDVDCFDFWFKGSGFGPEPNRQLKNPLV